MRRPDARTAERWGMVCLCLALTIAPEVRAQARDPFSNQAAAYLLQVQGETVLARQPTRPLPPASLTKVMTALLVLERARLEDVVTIGATAAQETGARLGLRPGEAMQVGDLLAAMILVSANEACHALADHIGGSEKGFVSLMNRRAQELSLRQTRFTNACGHDQDGHRSTARDLALLAQEAMHHPVYAALAATVRMRVKTINGSRTFELENKNELVGRYPGAIGVKTGFTEQAGKCVIAAAERNGRRVLLVLLNAPNRWWTAVAMLDYAFSASASLDQAGGVRP